MKGTATANPYADLVSDVVAPRAVWMAIAASLALRAGATPANAADVIMQEWRRLYESGVVSQYPRRQK